MNTRQLGKNGPLLTEIGLGAWAIGGPWKFGWGPQDDDESVRTIQAALDTGINWIDTAAVYGLGHSEEVVARAIKSRSNEVFVATKCGLVWDENKRTRNDLRPESIRRECEASLRRLQRDVIDLYQFHWPDPKTPVEDSWGEMVRLKEEGKVRFIGVSNFGVDLLQRCEAIHHINSLQPPYSLLHRIKYPEVEQEIIPWCKEHGVGVVVYSPMQAGLLTGKFTHNYLQNMASDDWRRRNEFFQEPFFSKALQIVDELRPIAEKHDKTVAQLAINWVLANSGVTAAIVGARSREQALENTGSSGWRISEEDLRKIDQIGREIFSQ